VDAPVDLGAPGHGRGVRVSEIGEGPEPDEEIDLGVAHEVLDDALGLGVAGLAEVGSEVIVGGECDVGGRGHVDVGGDATSETGHAVAEHDTGHAAQELEALREQTQRRGLVLVRGEAHEAPAAPGQHGAEDLQAVLLAPVDDEVLARDGEPGSIDAPAAAVVSLG
jgi:hypothetical protein